MLDLAMKAVKMGYILHLDKIHLHKLTKVRHYDQKPIQICHSITSVKPRSDTSIISNYIILESRLKSGLRADLDK